MHKKLHSCKLLSNEKAIFSISNLKFSICPTEMTSLHLGSFSRRMNAISFSVLCTLRLFFLRLRYSSLLGICFFLAKPIPSLFTSPRKLETGSPLNNGLPKLSRRLPRTNSNIETQLPLWMQGNCAFWVCPIVYRSTSIYLIRHFYFIVFIFRFYSRHCSLNFQGMHSSDVSRLYRGSRGYSQWKIGWHHEYEISSIPGDDGTDMMSGELLKLPQTMITGLHMFTLRSSVFGIAEL